MGAGKCSARKTEIRAQFLLILATWGIFPFWKVRQRGAKGHAQTRKASGGEVETGGKRSEVMGSGQSFKVEDGQGGGGPGWRRDRVEDGQGGEEPG